MHKKKLYLVKYEVRANSISEALKTRGVVYGIELADDKYQPETTKKLGFKKK